MANGIQPPAHDHTDRWFASKIGIGYSFDYVTGSSTTGPSARPLPPGLYRLAATTDCWIAQGTASNATATAGTDSYPLFIGQEAFAQVDTWVPSGSFFQYPYSDPQEEDTEFAARGMTANGTLYITQIDRIFRVAT